MDRIRGVVPVLAVPFTPAGEVDLDGFAGLVDHVLGTGVTAVLLFGLASEFHKLTDAERAALSQVLLAATVGRDDVAAVLSITDHSTEVACRRAREAEAAGADALNLLPPSFLSPGPDAVLAHITAVCASTSLPVVLQYAPAQTGTVLAPETIKRIPNLRMVKVESAPPGRMISALAPLPCLVGYAGVQLPDALRRGAVGVQPGCSAVEVYLEVWRRWEADGDLALHTRLLPHLAYWMQGVELVIQIEKTILARRGLIASDRCRAPGYTLDAEEHRAVDRFLEEFG